MCATARSNLLAAVQMAQRGKGMLNPSTTTPPHYFASLQLHPQAAGGGWEGILLIPSYYTTLKGRADLSQEKMVERQEEKDGLCLWAPLKYVTPICGKG